MLEVYSLWGQREAQEIWVNKLLLMNNIKRVIWGRDFPFCLQTIFQKYRGRFYLILESLFLSINSIIWLTFCLFTKISTEIVSQNVTYRDSMEAMQTLLLLLFYYYCYLAWLLWIINKGVLSHLDGNHLPAWKIKDIHCVPARGRGASNTSSTHWELVIFGFHLHSIPFSSPSISVCVHLYLANNFLVYSLVLHTVGSHYFIH